MSDISNKEYYEILSSIEKNEEFNINKIEIGATVFDFVFIHELLSVIMGPVGSGKSTGAILKILLFSKAIAKCKDGIRRSRWMVVRNTRKLLKDSTIKTLLQWLEPYGTFHKTDMNFVLKFDDVEAEIQFIALDDAKDLGKLAGMECTGVYFNELSEIDEDIYRRAQERIGRYPSLGAHGTLPWFDEEVAKEMGIEYKTGNNENIHPYTGKKHYSMKCVFGDTNPPMVGSYFQKLFEKQLFSEDGRDENPQSFKIFKQPSGLSPLAENLKNLDPNYYKDMVRNKPKEEVDVQVHVQYGLGSTGLAVYKNYFNRDRHVEADVFKNYTINEKLLIGTDFGLNPACIIGQLIDGKLYIYDEVYTKNSHKIGLQEFLDTKLIPLLREKYPKHNRQRGNILFTADPAGDQRNQLTGSTLKMEIKERGFGMRYEDTNNRIAPRLEAVKNVLSMKDGKTKVVIDNKCEWFINGLAGNYYYTKSKDGFKDEPADNEYTHIQDAFQYLCKHIVRFGDRYTKIDNITNNNYYENNQTRYIGDEKMGY